MSVETIPFQGELSYELPEISNHKDYSNYRSLIERIDGIIKISGLDLSFARAQLDKVNIKLSGEAVKKYRGSGRQSLPLYTV